VKANVVDLSGSKVRDLELDERVFGIKPNAAVVHQAVVSQQANARQGTHDTRTRGEVAGGGKKTLPPEGHWLRSTGFPPRAALPRRRHHFWSASALAREGAAAQNASVGNALGTVGALC